MIFSIIILFIVGFLGYKFLIFLTINKDKILDTFLENMAVLGSVFASLLTYYLTERAKAKERVALEISKQKNQAMQVYQNYLNNHFHIMKDRDFSPTNEHILESRRILLSQLPLFVSDSVLKQLASMQGKAKDLYYHQIKGNESLYQKSEEETLSLMNELIVLMRKDIISDTKIKGSDISDLLLTDYEFITWVREQEKKKSEIVTKS